MHYIYFKSWKVLYVSGDKNLLYKTIKYFMIFLNRNQQNLHHYHKIWELNLKKRKKNSMDLGSFKIPSWKADSKSILSDIWKISNCFDVLLFFQIKKDTNLKE